MLFSRNDDYEVYQAAAEAAAQQNYETGMLHVRLILERSINKIADCKYNDLNAIAHTYGKAVGQIELLLEIGIIDLQTNDEYEERAKRAYIRKMRENNPNLKDEPTEENKTKKAEE